MLSIAVTQLYQSHEITGQTKADIIITETRG